MLAPKRTKFRKHHFGKLKDIVNNTNTLEFGKWAIVSCEKTVLSAKTQEAVRRTLRKVLMRKGKCWLRVFPDMSVTQKPAEVRMGKGKGNVSHWVSRIRPGQVIYEIDGINAITAASAFQLARYKLPFRTAFVSTNLSWCVA